MKCPVCPFQEIPEDATRCPGCGTDLLPVLRLAELPRSYYNHAVELAAAGTLPGALAAAERAVAFDGDYVPARVLLGKLLWQTGKHTEAMAQWEVAAAADPQHEEVRRLLDGARAELRAPVVARRRMASMAVIAGLVVLAVAAFAVARVVGGAASARQQVARLATVNADLERQLARVKTGETKPVTRLAPVTAAPASIKQEEIEALRTKASERDKAEKAQRDKEKRAADTAAVLAALDGVMAEAERDRVVVKLQKGLFEPGNAVLKPVAAPLIQEIGKVLAAADGLRTVTVEGHTDDKPARKRSAWVDNLGLGQSRAATVAAELRPLFQARSIECLTTTAGDANPLFPNDSAANRSKNRTVIVYLIW